MLYFGEKWIWNAIKRQRIMHNGIHSIHGYTKEQIKNRNERNEETQTRTQNWRFLLLLNKMKRNDNQCEKRHFSRWGEVLHQRKTSTLCYKINFLIISDHKCTAVHMIICNMEYQNMNRHKTFDFDLLMYSCRPQFAKKFGCISVKPVKPAYGENVLWYLSTY